MIWIGFGLSAALAAFFAVMYYRERGKYMRLKRMRPNIEEMAAVMNDMNRLGGGLIEIKRVDPRSVFQYGG